MIVRLDKDTDPPRAVAMQRVWRPDNGKSHLRGNVQRLPNGNSFVAWSENAYITEHGPDGRLLMEARLQSKRFVTYRAYKQEFEGFPSESPALHVATHRAGESCATTHFVSWNGATEVGSWAFWREPASSGSEASLIGEAPRTGFETSYHSIGCENRVFAEARRHNGSVLGRSDTFVTEASYPARHDFDVQLDADSSDGFRLQGSDEL